MSLAALIGLYGLIVENPGTDRPPSLQRGPREREQAESAGCTWPSHMWECGGVQATSACLLCKEPQQSVGFFLSFPFLSPHPTPFCLLMKHSPSANHRGKANVQVARDRNSLWFLRTGVYFSHSLGKCLLNICFVPVSLLSPEEVTVNTQTKTLVGTEGDSWCTQALHAC